MLSVVLAVGCTAAAARAAAAEPCASPVLTLEETAALLRVAARDVRDLAEWHELPGRRIGAEWRFNCLSVMTWLNGDWRLDTALAAAELAQPLGADELGRITAAGIAGQEPSGTAAAQEQPISDGERIGEAPDEPSADDVLLRDQRILVDARGVSLNFAQFYTRSDSLALAATDGGSALAAYEQAALLTTFQARFGVLDETELFVGTSYIRQQTDAFLGSQKLASADAGEFGDVRLGVRHTLARERAGRPSIIGTLTAGIPTGDSSNSIGSGLGFVKSFDPVALFASLNYTRTFSDDFTDIARLEPEHRLDASLGFALALNDTLSLSGSVAAAFTSATTFPNATLRQQDRYSLGLGLTSRVASGVYLEPAVSVGLGGPADGFALGLSVFTFKP